MEAYYFLITKAAFYLYIVLLLSAAICDIWRFVIPNLLSIVLIGLFVLVAAVSPFPVDWLSHLGAALGFFVVGFGLYAAKALGAGDVKLLAAVSLWAGLDRLLDLLLFVALAGGALSIFLIVLRRFLPGFLLAIRAENTKLPTVLLAGEPVPYGVGIATGAIFIATSLPVLGYRAF